ncbi:hypothetical protein ACP70R_000017 [Stipagrostis hirtigluma subsp. patula]
MWSSDSDRDEPVETTATTESSSSSPSSPVLEAPPTPPSRRRRHRARRRTHRRAKNGGAAAEGDEEELPAEAEAEDVWRRLQQQQEAAAWPRRGSRPVVVAASDETGSADGASSVASGEGVARARSLTDDDLEELKGCVDLGFGFSYHEIPELCGTLPALELCYSMSQRFLDEHHQLAKPEDAAPAALAPASPAQPTPTNWKISSPGDSPDEVKARLKYWAQAVACTVRLCS